MSRSPSYHPIQYRRRNSALLLFCALVVSCAAQPKERGMAADSATMAKEPVAAPVMSETLQTQSVDESKDSAASPPPANAVAPASPRSKIDSKRGATGRSATPSAGFRSPKSSEAQTPQVSAAKPSLDESEAQPAYAEPPELTQALAEFDAQAETLSTSRACNDACRALQSMRRSAQRICELVLNDDPHARCRTARARLEQAEKELSVRCTTCT